MGNDPALRLPGVTALIDAALAEDLGAGDVTTEALVPPTAEAEAVLRTRLAGVIAGLGVAEAVFRRLDPQVVFEQGVAEGEEVVAGTVLATVRGRARALLSGERVALNFLQHLSGIATFTRAYVRAIAGTRARIVDTRKTTPGLRMLEKYAVRVGGGHNHRFGLSDGVLVKDNHLTVVGSLTQAIRRARQKVHHLLRVEVEVESLDQVREALAAGADILLLDNMSLEALREAVRLAQGRALTEASGGITLDNVAAVAATGVDFISVGALTHSAPALDIGLDFVSVSMP